MQNSVQNFPDFSMRKFSLIIKIFFCSEWHRFCCQYVLRHKLTQTALYMLTRESYIYSNIHPIAPHFPLIEFIFKLIPHIPPLSPTRLRELNFIVFAKDFFSSTMQHRLALIQRYITLISDK